MPGNSIEIDIPCDPQQLGEFAMPFALLSEARDPGRIAVGAIVITADDEDPVFARVHASRTVGGAHRALNEMVTDADRGLSVRTNATLRRSQTCDGSPSGSRLTLLVSMMGRDRVRGLRP